MYLIRGGLAGIMCILAIAGLGCSVYLAQHDQLEKAAPCLTITLGIAKAGKMLNPKRPIF